MNKKHKLTLSEDDLYEKSEKLEKTIQLVMFRLSNEWYGFDIGSVREVIKTVKWTYLPSGPDHILGIINLRGNIISVTDLKKVFGLADESMTEASRLVIINAEGVETALLADEGHAVIHVPASGIVAPLTTIAPDRAEYLKGECRVDDKLVGVLLAEKVIEKTKVCEGQ